MHYAGDCDFTYGYNTDRAKNPEISGSKYNIKENVRTEYERNFFTQSSTGGDSDGFCCPHSIPSGEGWAKYGEYCQLTQTIPRPAEGCYPIVDDTATELFDTMFTDTTEFANTVITDEGSVTFDAKGDITPAVPDVTQCDWPNVNGRPVGGSGNALIRTQCWTNDVCKDAFKAKGKAQAIAAEEGKKAIIKRNEELEKSRYNLCTQNKCCRCHRTWGSGGGSLARFFCVGACTGPCSTTTILGISFTTCQSVSCCADTSRPMLDGNPYNSDSPLSEYRYYPIYSSKKHKRANKKGLYILRNSHEYVHPNSIIYIDGDPIIVTKIENNKIKKHEFIKKWRETHKNYTKMSPKLKWLIESRKIECLESIKELCGCYNALDLYCIRSEPCIRSYVNLSETVGLKNCPRAPTKLLTRYELDSVGRRKKIIDKERMLENKKYFRMEEEKQKRDMYATNGTIK